jgi:uncharacterized cupin superfamily protein
MVTHWDEVEGVITDVGDLRGTWRRLGRAAGTIGVGANRIDLPPGGRSTPVHTHTAEEEIFFVLGGSGVSWQDGHTYRVAPGDCLLHAVGSQATGLKHATVRPGMLSSLPHCHSSEEEIFVVLEGSGTLLLGDEEHPMGPGSVVARPPGTGAAHAFRAGDDGLAMLCYGTREPGDIRYYPRSRTLAIPGLRASFTVEQVDLWDREA